MQDSFDIAAGRLRPELLMLAKRFFRVTGLREDPEDVVQEALLKLWHAENGGAAIRDRRAWAVTAAKHLCISRYRKWRSRSQCVAMEPDVQDPATADTSLAAAEAGMALENALDRLSPGTRTLLRMRAAGMSLDAIAAATGRPKTSVKSALSAARKQIVNQFNKTI